MSRNYFATVIVVCLFHLVRSSSPKHLLVNSPMTETFSYTGTAQSWTVPGGVTTITIEAFGAKGGKYTYGFDPNGGYDGGLGGSISATMTVVPGTQCYIYVGGMPTGNGGYNGGGKGVGNSAGGGGGTDFRYGSNSESNIYVIAAGGGGNNYNCGAGGAGGGLNGVSAVDTITQCGGYGGGGATQTAGGAGAAQGNGGWAGNSGSKHNGGDAVYASPKGNGGGGGGGWYGGGAGSSAGGGGGSSYAVPSCTNVVYATGVHSGHGVLNITYIPFYDPTMRPTIMPTVAPTVIPSMAPTQPTLSPSVAPTITPSFAPTMLPTIKPSYSPSLVPSLTPTMTPSIVPSFTPTIVPTTFTPTELPSTYPTESPTLKTNTETVSLFQSTAGYGIIGGIAAVVLICISIALYCCCQSQSHVYTKPKEVDTVNRVGGVEMIQNVNETEKFYAPGYEEILPATDTNENKLQVGEYGYTEAQYMGVKV